MSINRTGVCTTQYRSDGLPRGALRQLGTMHLHIDGGGKADLVLNLVRELEAKGAGGKLTAVTRSVAGPQRKDQPTTYSSHTPGTGDEEELEYFSTSGMTDRIVTVGCLKDILPKLNDHPGSVVEVERVVATVGGHRWCQVDFDEVAPIEGYEVGFRNRTTLPFEVHHAIDVAVGTEPILLDQLLRDTTKLGIVVGGWFNFAKEAEWSYRSNSFWPAEGLRERVLAEYAALDGYLIQRGLTYQIWTIVEQVIGIWRAPLEPTPGG